MGRKKKADGGGAEPPVAKLPKGALSRITLGDSFAEYDALLLQREIFVETNAFLAAKDPARNKCFFIGRRGTGKTAITIQLQNTQSNVIQVFPELFGPLDTSLDDRHGLGDDTDIGREESDLGLFSIDAPDPTQPGGHAG